jgi:hypothetical protein
VVVCDVHDRVLCVCHIDDDVQRIIDTIVKGKLQGSLSKSPLGNNNNNNSLDKALAIS